MQSKHKILSIINFKLNRWQNIVNGNISKAAFYNFNVVFMLNDNEQDKSLSR